jgi:hypothetical protein
MAKRKYITTQLPMYGFGDWIKDNSQGLLGGLKTIGGAAMMATGFGAPMGMGLMSSGISDIGQEVSGDINRREQNELQQQQMQETRQQQVINNRLSTIPQMQFKTGGGIYIKPSKRGTFTAAATKRGKSVQGFASQVMANKENYSPAMVKKANFARNAAKWKREDGGYIPMYPDGGDLNYIGKSRQYYNNPINMAAQGYGMPKTDTYEFTPEQIRAAAAGDVIYQRPFNDPNTGSRLGYERRRKGATTPEYIGINTSPDETGKFNYQGKTYFKGTELPGSKANGGKFPRKGSELYDIDRAIELGYTPDETGHMSSRDYKTGRILKHPAHPTFNKAIEGDKKLGYTSMLDPLGNVYTVSPEDIPREGYFSPDRKADGGYLEETRNNPDVTYYANGGTHESNPNKGIPIGNKGLTEEGEVRYKDYIFTNRF